MGLFRSVFLFLLLFLGGGLVSPLLAQIALSDGTQLSESPLRIVSYIETFEGTQQQVFELISARVESAKQAPGNQGTLAVQRIARDNQFALVELWESPEDFMGYAGTLDARVFRQGLQNYLTAPFDERWHFGLAVSSNPLPINLPANLPDSTIVVLTHVDLAPPEQFAPCSLSMTDETHCGNYLLTSLAQNSRSQDGNILFEVWFQEGRTNHMTLVEFWEDSASQLAHHSESGKLAFRFALSGLTPGEPASSDPERRSRSMMGSLWDERLYSIISQ